MVIKIERLPAPLSKAAETMFRILPLFSRKITSDFETDRMAREQGQTIIDFVLSEHDCYRPDSPQKTPLYYYLLRQIEQADIFLPNNKPNDDSPVKTEKMTPEEKLLAVLSVARETLSDFDQADDGQKRTTLGFFSLLGQICKPQKID
ncbi:MAG: hypothetical protein PHR64_01365 [Candidatus Shapirobacteria bacterium]|nr:hypothetical protein [Candidatus Shapirobacteria bacterium]MDD5074027.1 hypothetical protein [Candidatus Shapirobacteria bacterium]MDD5481582.1 hypothetical protein [Candidatus Shapirobacteria bacterium]